MIQRINLGRGFRGACLRLADFHGLGDNSDKVAVEAVCHEYLHCVTLKRHPVKHLEIFVSKAIRKLPTRKQRDWDEKKVLAAEIVLFRVMPFKFDVSNAIAMSTLDTALLCDVSKLEDQVHAFSKTEAAFHRAQSAVTLIHHSAARFT